MDVSVLEYDIFRNWTKLASKAFLNEKEKKSNSKKVPQVEFELLNFVHQITILPAELSEVFRHGDAYYRFYII